MSMLLNLDLKQDQTALAILKCRMKENLCMRRSPHITRKNSLKTEVGLKDKTLLSQPEFQVEKLLRKMYGLTHLVIQ